MKPTHYWFRMRPTGITCLLLAVVIQASHVHMYYGQTATQRIITWSHSSNLVKPVLRLSGHVVDAVSYKFTNENGYESYLNVAVLEQLERGMEYCYDVGDLYSEEFSNRFCFQVPATDEHRVAVFGDLGAHNDVILEQLAIDQVQDKIDAVIHVGDLAYNLDWEHGKIGDDFEHKIETIAGRIPYMICPGNHGEIDLKFADSMSGRSQV